MYKLKIEIYTKPTSKLEIDFDQWNDAHKSAAFFASVLVSVTKLSRHCNCDDPIHHMDKYFDLYNELSIKLEPVRKSSI